MRLLISSESTTAAEVIEGIDLTGERAVVTGASSGIGVETARALAGAEVTLAVRNTDAGDRASVAAFVATWSGPLHLLVNNAGVMALPDLQLTPEGWEMQFVTYHLGHFALALGLHDALAAAGDARIVALSSGGHLQSPVIFDDLNFASRPYDPWLAYGQSKTAIVLFAVEATRRWAQDGITANAVHPGLDRGHQPRTVHRPGGRSGPPQLGFVHGQDARARRRDERSRRDFTSARGHRRPLLRGLQ